MSIKMNIPDAGDLGRAVHVLREWQFDRAPLQLHTGDLGWHWRFGAGATARAVRDWSRDGQILAVGLVDGSDLVRLAIAPDSRHDEELARQMAMDVTQPERGVLPQGSVSVEARCEGVFRDLMLANGWGLGESWALFRRDLAKPVQDCGLQVEVIGAKQARVRVAVQRAAFGGSTFTEERWHAMAAGLPYADAQCLVAYDEHGVAVAAATVWSAGSGIPGLLEPMGVHREHRGHGYGKAITVAAQSALREAGSSSAIVCCESSNVAAVATYSSAGFQRLPDARDLCRSA